MKAAWLKDWKEVSIEDVPMPEIGNEEALIRVKYAGICGSDLHVYNGHHSTAIKPIILGHEFSGEIAAINTCSKSRLKVGDRVVVQPYTACNVCDLCVQGRDNICKDLKIFGVHTNGCFCEYIKVPIKKVYPIPPNVDMRLATLIEPLAVAVHDVRRSDLKAGQTALIIGGGPIGLLIALVARLSGAAEIVLSEVNEYRISLARDLGFTVINPMETDIERELLCEGFDVVFEVSGTAQGAALMTKAAKTGGKIIIIGVPRGKYEVDTGAILARELEMLGVRVHAQINFAAAIAIMGKGQLNQELQKIITNEFDLSQISEAIEFSLQDQQHMKVILKVEDK